MNSRKIIKKANLSLQSGMQTNATLVLLLIGIVLFLSLLSENPFGLKNNLESIGKGGVFVLVTGFITWCYKDCKESNTRSYSTAYSRNFK